MNASKRTFKNNLESFDHVTRSHGPPSLYRDFASSWKIKTKPAIERKSVKLLVFRKQASVLS